MATLRQAVERLRVDGTIPASGTVSLKGLRRQFAPLPSYSVRALMGALFAKVSVRKPWAVILCRFKGSPADLSAREAQTERFFLEAFTPGNSGLVEYWRDASLGAIDIAGSRVFGWVDLEIERRAAGGTPQSTPPGPGRAGLTEYAIKALKQREGEHALDGLLGPIVVFTENWTDDDVPPGTTWQTPGFWHRWIDGSSNGVIVCLTPPFDGNVTAHEMGHVMGMHHDVAADLTTDYQDPCCIMSQNGALTHPRWQVNFGPAVCLPHHIQQGWMYGRRLFSDAGSWMAAPDGITLPLAPLSCPAAPANLGIRLAFSRGEEHWDYFLEYAVPTEWNAAVVGLPCLLIRRMSTKYGGTPAYLEFVPVPDDPDASSEKVERSGNVLFRVQRTRLQGPVISVTVKKL